MLCRLTFSAYGVHTVCRNFDQSELQRLFVLKPPTTRCDTFEVSGEFSRSSANAAILIPAWTSVRYKAHMPAQQSHLS
jgi:hypothetical protein